MRRLMLSVSLASLFALCLAPAPAAAMDFSIFGSYIDTGDVDDGWGGGARLAFFNKIQLQLTGTWYAAFDHVIVPDDITGNDFNDKVDIIPLDVGGAWYFGPDATRFYAGAGLSYFLLESDFGNMDDEVGFYVQVGYQFKGFFIEGLYRDAEGTIKNFQGDLEFLDRVKLDLTGYSINLGWRF